MYHVLRMPAGDWPEPVQRAHLEMMARRLPQGRYLHCPDGSHLAMYDDQQVYFAGLIDFLRTL